MRFLVLIALTLLTSRIYAQFPYLGLTEKEIRDQLVRDKEVTEVEIHYTSKGRKSLRFFKGSDIVNTLIFDKNERTELQVIHPVGEEQIERIKKVYNKFKILEPIDNNTWAFIENPTSKKYIIQGKKLKAYFRTLDVYVEGYYFIISDKQFYSQNEKDIIDRIKKDNLY